MPLPSTPDAPAQARPIAGRAFFPLDPANIVQMLKALKDWARKLKRDVVAVWLAARNPRIPLGAKILALMVAGYALSPIDLIPDFVPVLGLLDDLILVPLGLWLAIRLIPPDLMAELRMQAEEWRPARAGRVAAMLIIALWLAGSLALALWLLDP